MAKKITLENVAAGLVGLTVSVEDLKVGLEKLAIMTQNGFTSLREELLGEINGVKGELDNFRSELRAEITDIKSRLTAIENQLDTHDLKFEYIIWELQDIKRELSCDQVDIIHLESRVARLEKQVGLKQPKSAD